MKTSSLGDVIHHCPAVSDAARRQPGVEIDWIVEEAFAEVPAMHARVHRVIPVSLRRWRKALLERSTWSEFTAFREQLARGRYDAVIDTQGLLKSALLSRLANAQRVHGFDRASAREPLAALFYDARHCVDWDVHAVERNRRLTAKALGYTADEALDYGLSAQRSSEPTDFVFFTMTARAEKLWPEESWIELGRALRARVVLPWGSEPERARAERIAAALGEAVVPPRMTLRDIAMLIARSRAVIGVDTGLTHLAAALGVPAIALFSGTDPARYGLRGAAFVRNLGSERGAPSVEEVLKAIP